MDWNKGIGVYLEQRENGLSPLSIELLGKARQLADNKGLPVIGFLLSADGAEAAKAAIAYGADGVALVEDAKLAAFDGALYTKALAQAVEQLQPGALLIGGSPEGRELGGRLSAKLEVGLVADSIDVRYEGEDDTLTWIRPAYTGKLFVKIQTTTRPQLATISDKIFHGTPADPNRQGEVKKLTVDLGDASPLVKVAGFVPLAKVEGNLDLMTADIVVGAGRGVANKEGMEEVQAFAKRIGAGFGISKPLVDAGWAPHDWQVGITGKKIAPKVYIALGISGAIQHKLGIQDVECIVAVNKDPDAPIFQFAHYGLVGDLFDVMPELEKLLKKN